MHKPELSFFQPGGPLPPGARSYVERKADAEVVDALRRGELCFVVGAPQTGRSSLALRTAASLKPHRIASVTVDLASLASSQHLEEWCDGLRAAVAGQLGLEADLADFYLWQGELPPVERWFASMGRIVLPSLKCPLVLFLDGMEIAGRLPFSVEPFFEMIEDCLRPRRRWGRSAAMAALGALDRLGFCLLGAGDAGMLAWDLRGEARLVELADFDEHEARSLAAGLSTNGAAPGSHEVALLRRVLYWTGGQPYLTQKLCHAVAAAGPSASPESVDDTCRELFFCGDGVQRDVHLSVLSRQLTETGPNGANLRALFARVASGPPLREKDLGEGARDLLRSGLLRAERIVQARNRVYASAFASLPSAGEGTPVTAAEPAESPAARAPAPDMAAAAPVAVCEPATPMQTAAAEPVRSGGAVVRTPLVPGRARARWPLRALVAALCLGAAALAYDGTYRLVSGLRSAHRVAPSATAVVVRDADAAADREAAAETRASAERDASAAMARRDRELAQASQDLAAAENALRQGHGSADAWRSAGALRAQAAAHTGTARRCLYVVHVARAMQAWEAGNVREAVADLKAEQPAPGQEDLRGFDWRYLWRLTHSSAALFDGHQAGVTAVAYSPDGRLLATASRDGTVRLWDVPGKRGAGVLQGGHGRLLAVAIAPSGRLLAAGAEDGTVRLWELPSRRDLGASAGHRGHVTGVAFSRDGRLLASAGSDGVVKLWSTADRREAGALAGSVGPLTCVAFSPDGSTIATGGLDGRLRFWDGAARHEVGAVQAHGGAMLALAFSPSGSSLATSGADGIVKLWDAPGRRPIAAVRAHSGPAGAVAFSPDGKLLVSGGDDGLLRRWDAAALAPLGRIRGHWGEVWGVAVSPGGSFIASASGDTTARLWRSGLRQECDLLGETGRSIAALRFAPQGAVLAAGADDGSVALWGAADQRALGALGGGSGPAASVAISPDGRLLAAVGRSAVQLWDVHSRRAMASLAAGGAPAAVAFSPDGRTMAVAGRGQGVRLWDVTSNTLGGAGTLGGPAEASASLAYSTDGRVLATGGDDGVVRLWDTRTRALRGSLCGHKGPVLSLRFGPDGRSLVCGGADGSVTVWDAWDRRRLASLTGHGGAVRCVAYSSDGRTIVSVGDDHAVRLWSAAAGMETLALAGHTAGVEAAAFSRGGDVLATGGGDGTVRLWRALEATPTAPRAR